MSRCGTAKTHCCWHSGKVCPFLDGPKEFHLRFRYSCLLRKKYGDWDKVHRSPEYLEWVKPRMIADGVEVDCGDWPPRGVKCNDCGEIG